MTGWWRRSAVLMTLATLFAGPIVAFTAAPAAAAGCAVTHYGYTGYKICNTVEGDHYHGGQNTEYFVIGTDHAIWHTWYGAKGWYSLGGVAPTYSPFGTYNGVWVYGIGSNFHIMTYGQDGDQWCRRYPWKEWWKVCP